MFLVLCNCDVEISNCATASTAHRNTSYAWGNMFRRMEFFAFDATSAAQTKLFKHVHLQQKHCPGFVHNTVAFYLARSIIYRSSNRPHLSLTPIFTCSPIAQNVRPLWIHDCIGCGFKYHRRRLERCAALIAARRQHFRSSVLSFSRLSSSLIMGQEGPDLSGE